MARPLSRIGIALEGSSPVRIASRLRRVSARFYDPPAYSLVLIGLPERRGSARLDTGEMFAPLRILRSFQQSFLNCRTMFRGIKTVTVTFPIVQTNMLRRRHPLDIGRAVVTAIEIQVMTMRSRTFAVDLMPEIPLIRQSMRRIQMPIDRLVHHLVAAKNVAIERHQRVPWSQALGLSHTAVTSHELMIGRDMNSLAVVQFDLEQRVAADEPGCVQKTDNEAAVLADAVAPEELS